MRLWGIATNIKKGNTVISEDHIVQIEKEVNKFVKATQYRESEEKLCSEERWTWTLGKNEYLMGCYNVRELLPEKRNKSEF